MVAAPLTPEELIARADLAGYARVLRVEDGRATLRFTRLLKGLPKGRGLLYALGWGRTVTVWMHAKPPNPALGEWWDEGIYQPGTRLLIHLRWDDRAGAYETFWWNGVSRA